VVNDNNNFLSPVVGVLFTKQYCVNDIVSLTQYCLFINNHVGKAAGRMLNPPHCEILRTPVALVEYSLIAFHFRLKDSAGHRGRHAPSIVPDLLFQSRPGL